MDIKRRLACFYSHLSAHQVDTLAQQGTRLPRALQDYLESPQRSSLYDRIEADMDWLHRSDNHHIISFTHSDYPPLLKEIKNPPCLFFAVGDASLLRFPHFAIVGCRKPSHTGMNNATFFAARLAQQGLCIVSGLAYGIDAAAHKASLESGGRTIAIIGTGIDLVYPKAHLKLATEIAARGLILSIFPRATNPLRQNFPLRNRIISGMSLGVLVVEAGIQSGALITARLAADQGRVVYALPGSIHSHSAKGCHKLIREGAVLVENCKDILDEIEPLYQGYQEKSISVPEPVSSSPAPLSANARKLFKRIDYHPIHPNQLAIDSHLNIQNITAALTELELLSLVTQNNGLYSRIDRSIKN